MSAALSPILKICLFSLSFLFAWSEIALSQVTPDNTVNTRVEQNGSVAEITGGETRGDNLFHSFEDFSIQTGNEAFFNNANDIGNIFSRVTGGNISNIDGAIRANGSANLFLINPAGIIFGENASLDIGGSFYGSSATSILFEDGQFSATDVDSQPLLTVNAPIGLNFRDEPGEIVNRSVAPDDTSIFSFTEVGLEVLPGNTLALIGGNIRFDNASATAADGNIELGGLSEAGTVSINENGSLSFPDDVALSDVAIINGSTVSVLGTGSGNIDINARNLEVSADPELGEFRSISRIIAGVEALSDSPDVAPGNVTINVTENLSIDDSRISTQIRPLGTGNLGNVFINTGSLSLTNGGGISGSVAGQGDAGSINITAIDDIIIDGEDFEGLPSRISSLGESIAEGNAGSINISSNNLNITNGGQINASTLGMGDTGAIAITTTEDITVEGETEAGIASGIVNGVGIGAEGNASSLTISARNFTLTDGGIISAGTTGIGNGGSIDITAIENITFNGENSIGNPSGIVSVVDSRAVGNAGSLTISTENLSLVDGAVITAGTAGIGNGGSIDITATENITFNGESFTATPSGISNVVFPNAEGDAGSVSISTRNLNLNDGAQISASSAGIGDAGAIAITVTENTVFDGETEAGVASGAYSTVNPGAEGNARGISLETNSLTLTDGGVVSASTGGEGNAGNVNITAENIFISGEDSLGFSSGILANAVIGNGNGGDVSISTNQLTIENNGTVEASNFDDSGNFPAGTGEPGNIAITAENIALNNRGSIEAGTQSAVGDGANITLQIAEDITLNDGGLISAEAINQGNGGNLDLDSRFIIAFPNGNNDIIASAEQGQGGNINISAESIFGIEERPLNDTTNDLNASSQVVGLSGDVTLETLNFDPLQGVIEVVEQIIVPQETTVQACNSNREAVAQSGLSIGGKGGVPPAPDLPLISENILDRTESNATIEIPEPIETGIGKIQLARGIEVTDEGVKLTAYRTNDAGERLPEIKANCGA